MWYLFCALSKLVVASTGTSCEGPLLVVQEGMFLLWVEAKHLVRTPPIANHCTVNLTRLVHFSSNPSLSWSCRLSRSLCSRLFAEQACDNGKIWASAAPFAEQASCATRCEKLTLQRGEIDLGSAIEEAGCAKCMQKACPL